MELPGVTALGEQWAEHLVPPGVLEAHARLVETAAAFTTAALYERVTVPEPDLKLDRADLGLRY